MDKELQKQLENAMDIQLKNDVQSIKDELERLTNGKQYDTFDTIEQDVVELLCKENDLNPTKQFKDAMTTPFAIAKYISLKAQEDEICTEIDKDLKTLFDNNETTWVLHRDLSNEITFSKDLQEDTIPQRLIVKYRKDPLSDKIVYSLNGNWDISKQQLKAIVEYSTMPSKNESTNLRPTIKTLSDNELLFEIGDLFTISCKKI